MSASLLSSFCWQLRDAPDYTFHFRERTAIVPTLDSCTASGYQIHSVVAEENHLSYN